MWFSRCGELKIEEAALSFSERRLRNSGFELYSIDRYEAITAEAMLGSSDPMEDVRRPGTLASLPGNSLFSFSKRSCRSE